MASNYPAALDTTSTYPIDITDDTDSKAGTPRTGVKGFLAQLLDDHSAAIIAVETELGTLPKGTNATSVKDRLDQNERKALARVASTANIVLPVSGTSLAVDGITLVENDRVLLKDQTAPAENGIYAITGVGAAITLTRTTDADTSAEIGDTTVGVQVGTLNADTQWRMVTSPPIVMGSTALRWTRYFPDYGNPSRHPWEIGATPPLATNMGRDAVTASVAQTVITAITSFHGGMVLRAGTTYTNINAFCTATGSGALTSHWFALIKQSDRTTLQRTANTTTLPTLGVHSRALQATYTPDVDTPVWVAWGSQVATTSPAFAGMAVLTALVQPFAVQGPIFQGNSTTAPTSTPPTVGAVLGAPTTATSPLIYFWLT